MPVTDIINLPTTAIATVPLTLNGTVLPSNATNQTILWNIVNAGTTGATITDNILNTTASGTCTLLAKIVNGASSTTDFTKQFTVIVNKGTQEAPAAPTMLSHTSESITLNTVEGCEYNITGGAWQSSPVFTGLTPSTSYIFAQRKAETPSHLPSPVSPTATFKTKETPVPLYTITSSVNNTAWGVITPYGETKVEEGSDIIFTIISNLDCIIDDVLINGISVGAKETYIFENVHSDETIAVIFKETVGVEPFTNHKLRISVFPNPTTGELRITNHELRIEGIEVFDMMGKKLLSQPSLLSPETTINISHLPNSIYFLQIKTDQGLVNKKVIRQ